MIVAGIVGIVLVVAVVDILAVASNKNCRTGE